MRSEGEPEHAEAAYERLNSTLDRFQEAHFWLHMMERHYHDADPFRWHLNVFIKALKEVPILAARELQNDPGFAAWFRPHRAELATDPLIASLAKSRDRIVHGSMLVPESRAAVGVTEGRGMKLGMSFPIHPLEDSDSGMLRYLANARHQGRDFLGILMPDDDSLPCVEREWRLQGFDEEVIDLCSRAWLRVGETVANILEWLGAEVPPQTLGCRTGHQAVRFKTYSREALASWSAQLPEANP